jgi:hypothetical protein
MVNDITKDDAKASEASVSTHINNEAWDRQANSLGQPSQNTAAERTLAPLTITDTKDKSASPAPAESKDPAEANNLLLQAADQTVNLSIYKLPKWAALPKPSPGLGCVSSFSNRYREALHLAGIIDSPESKQYRNYYQVNMDELNKVMGRDRLLNKISATDVKEGDIIEGVTPDTSKRHMGIVGRMENGQRMVYYNFGGTWLKEPLDYRFKQYEQNNYYRAYLPQKK